jgi:hypothetical protein
MIRHDIRSNIVSFCNGNCLSDQSHKSNHINCEHQHVTSLSESLPVLPCPFLLRSPVPSPSTCVPIPPQLPTISPNRSSAFPCVTKKRSLKVSTAAARDASVWEAANRLWSSSISCLDDLILLWRAYILEPWRWQVGLLGRRPFVL